MCGRWKNFDHQQKPECHEVMRVCGRVVEKTENYIFFCIFGLPMASLIVWLFLAFVVDVFEDESRQGKAEYAGDVE